MKNARIELKSTKKLMKHRFIANKKAVELDVVFEPSEVEVILDNWGKFNRPIDKDTVEKYKRAIETGGWDYNAGVAIKFDKCGRLFDGQHRAKAHLELGVSFRTDVIYGLPVEAMKVTDGGKVRLPHVNPTLFGAIGIGSPPEQSDYSKTKFRQSIARLIMANEQGKAWVSPSSMELELACAENAIYIDMASVPPLKHWKKRPGPRAAIALYAKRDMAKAVEFRDKYLGDGSGFQMGSPILLLRDRISMKKARGGMSTVEDMEITIYAIHAFHTGSVLRRLRPQHEWNF